MGINECIVTVEDSYRAVSLPFIQKTKNLTIKKKAFIPSLKKCKYYLGHLIHSLKFDGVGILFLSLKHLGKILENFLKTSRSPPKKFSHAVNSLLRAISHFSVQRSVKHKWLLTITQRRRMKAQELKICHYLNCEAILIWVRCVKQMRKE